jgi:hypothetical protein
MMPKKMRTKTARKRKSQNRGVRQMRVRMRAMRPLHVAAVQTSLATAVTIVAVMSSGVEALLLAEVDLSNDVRTLVVVKGDVSPRLHLANAAVVITIIIGISMYKNKIIKYN